MTTIISVLGPELIALAKFFKRRFFEPVTALIISVSDNPKSSCKSPVLMFLAGKNRPARFMLLTSINSLILKLFFFSSSILVSASITSVKADPIKPAGTAKMAIPRMPITQAIRRPVNVIGGVLANPPGSPIYCANAHTTDFHPLL